MEKDEDGYVSIGQDSEKAFQQGSGLLKWSDVQHALAVLDAWQRTPEGRDEEFLNSFISYFPLHDKPVLHRLTEIWGSYALIKRGILCGRQDLLPDEMMSEFALHDVRNKAERRSVLIHQPIDEIRDYFGDEIALYFAWTGTTRVS